ncbi:MAG: hydrogenase 2 operon protein HybA [Acidobacteriota bacterium]
MGVDRRTALKGMAVAGAALLTSGAGDQAREPHPAPSDAVGMLYDATLCIGCKTCVVACREANDMPPERTALGGGIYDSPISLDGQTRNIIKLYEGTDGKSSYMKAQCMHCLDPACVGACMIGALQKREHGIVTWDGSRCIGCRYCQVACPYLIPKFTWDRAIPKIVKCEMCVQRIDQGKIPGCCEVCPRSAVIFGKYEDLLAEAKDRLKKKPDRYYPKVFGERDGGGTQVLYLSKAGISFTDLGLPALGDTPVPELSQEIQHAAYKGFIAPAVLYVVLGTVIWRNKKAEAKGKEGQA